MYSSSYEPGASCGILAQLQTRPFDRTPSDIADIVSYFTQHLAYFDGLPARAVAHIAKWLGVQKLDPGQYVFKEGDVADKLYIVLEGSCHTLRTESTEQRSHYGETGSRTIATCTALPCDAFGEMGLFVAHKRRSAGLRLCNACWWLPHVVCCPRPACSAALRTWTPW